MKRITLWLLSTVSVVVLLFGYDASTASTTLATPPVSIESTTTGSAPAASGSGSTSSGSTSGRSTSSGSTSSGSTSDGSTSSGSTTKPKTVTGDTASTEWGPVQVELTIKAGTITAVAVPQYPNGNPKDQEINSYALPILIQETTDQQSASIDMVSGATVTSVGYLQSLQSALDRAGL